MQVESSIWFAMYCTGIHGYDCLALLNLKHEKDLHELIKKFYVVNTESFSRYLSKNGSNNTHYRGIKECSLIL
jgi:hypothetical protein